MNDGERARLIAIVTRRRKQLERLERDVLRVRNELADAELALTRFQHAVGKRKHVETSHLQTDAELRTGETCNAAGKALRRCKNARQGGGKVDELCGDAGRALRRCADAKKRIKR